MTDTARRVFVESLPAIVASLVISLLGGAFGVYVGYRLVEQRVTRNETDIAKLVSRADSRDERLSRIEANTEYIRGKLESLE